MADMFDTKRKTTSFAIGETVRLKSGGPDMSVVVSHSGQTHCVWFGDRPYHQSFGGCFPDEALVPKALWLEEQRKALFAIEEEKQLRKKL